MKLRTRDHRPGFCRGQSSLETAVILGFVVALFFVGRPSLLERLIAALASVYPRFSSLLALP
ncbi:MAG: hypothetical protein R3E83_21445 [Burkholderiaceae bacterium]